MTIDYWDGIFYNTVMKLLSTYYWNRQDTLLLQQYRTYKGEFILAICCEAKPLQQVAAKQITEEMACWVHLVYSTMQRRLHSEKAIARALSRQLYHISLKYTLPNLETGGAHPSTKAVVSGLGIFISLGRHYMAVRYGSVSISIISPHLLGHLFTIRQNKQIAENPNSIYRGTLKKGFGYIISGGEFGKIFSSRQKGIILLDKLVNTEEQITKRLKEIAMRNLESGGGRCFSAIFITVR